MPFQFENRDNHRGELRVEQPQPKNSQIQSESEIDSVVFEEALYSSSSMGQDIGDYDIVDTTARKEELKLFLSYKEKEGKNLPVMLSGSDGLFAIVLIIFLLFSFSFKEIISFMRENVVLAFSPSKGQKIYDKTITSKERFNLYLLTFSCVLILSISFFVVLENSSLVVAKNYAELLITIGLFMLALSFFITVKLLVNKLIGYIFEIREDSYIWNSSYLILFSALGATCFIPVLLLIYSRIQFDIIVAIVLILFLIVQLSVIVRVVRYFMIQRFSILFLIAYLCTVEIIPYLCLGLGMVYLYKVDIF